MNILGDGIIVGDPVHKGSDYRVQYANTPVFAPEIIPPGRAAHVGNGVFRYVCAGGCGLFAERWGGWGWCPEMAEHEHKDHGLDVPGYNVAMLP